MKDSVILKIKRLRPDTDIDIPLPEYMSPQAAGLDLYAGIGEDILMMPGDIVLVPTGLALSIPNGYEVQIRPRSGLAVKHGIGIINAPGTIDSDYRGEIHVALINFSKLEFMIRRGDRIAQMILSRVYRASFELVDELDNTLRSNGGFGHTGR